METFRARRKSSEHQNTSLFQERVEYQNREEQFKLLARLAIDRTEKLASREVEIAQVGSKASDIIGATETMHGHQATRRPPTRANGSTSKLSIFKGM